MNLRKSTTAANATPARFALYLCLFVLLLGVAASFASEDKNAKKGLPFLPPASIQAYDYDDQRSEFVVTLADGERLLVRGVPERVYEEFNLSDAKVAYFNRIIRPNFKGCHKPPRKAAAVAKPGKATVYEGQCSRGMFQKIFTP